MVNPKGAGILSIILGILLILFPIVSADIISIIVGVGLLLFGISAIVYGVSLRDTMTIFSIALIIIGFIIAILGGLFIFYIDALSFLISIQFYIVGFIMLVAGIAGLVSHRNSISTVNSTLITLIGIGSILLAVFAMAEPIYIAIIIGVVLIIQGVSFIFIDY